MAVWVASRNQAPLEAQSRREAWNQTLDAMEIFPQKYRAITTSTCQHPPIRAECHAMDYICMPGEGALVYTRGGIPQPHRLVPTPTGERAPIWTERHAIDHICMPGEGSLLFTCHNIPQPHRPGRISTGERTPI